jgi:hypothetical protein
MDVRHATPDDAPDIAALGGGAFTAAEFMSHPRTRLLVWAERGRPAAAFAAFTWGPDGGPIVLNGLGPERLGEKMVAHLLALSGRHGRPGVLAAAPETDSQSRNLFTRFPCRTRLRRAVGPGVDDIEYFMPQS